jgi:HAD superfamily hydrolase (TIGR01457 family)
LRLEAQQKSKHNIPPNLGDSLMDKNEILRSKKLYLFDMDGTLYLGNRLYDFTLELLDTLKKTGRKYLFMTNNSSKSVEDYVKKLGKLGIGATREDFMTSSQATAFYLHKHHEGQKLYVCGTESLKEELRMEGFTVTTDIDEVECIVMGFDTELTFQKLHDVSYMLLTRPDLPYIATNPDYVCPTEFGSVPDCGSVCDMIYNATKKRPVVIGKPSPLMPQLAMEKLGVSKEETCVVGDRIYTDVKSGLNAGITGILVLSGETTREILESSSEKPHLVIQDAGEILDALILP